MKSLYDPLERTDVAGFLTARFGSVDIPSDQANLARLAITSHVHDSYTFFASNFLHTFDKGGKNVLMKPFVGQAIHRVSLDSQLRAGLPGRLVEVKARSLGWTTENLGRALHFILDENRRAFVLVDDEDVATEQATKFNTMLNGLPAWMQPMRRIQNMKHLWFDNPNPKDRLANPGLNSISQITVPSSFRGVNGALFVCISEYAHMDEARQEAVNIGLISALGNNPYAVLIIDTTPNGPGDSYHEMVMEAVEDNPRWTRRIENHKGEVSAEEVLEGFFGIPDCVEKGRPGKMVPAICPWRYHEEYTVRDKQHPLGQIARFTKELRGELESTLGNVAKYGGEEEVELRDKYGVSIERLFWRRCQIDNYKFPTDEQKLLAFRQEFLSCIEEGQRVSTARGLIPIEQAVVGDVTPEGPVRAVHDFGTKPIVELTTKSGRVIRCTGNHWMLTPEGDVQAENMLGKEFVFQKPMFPKEPYTLTYDGFANTTVSLTVGPDLGRLLGYYMADGWYIGTTVGFACDIRDQDVVEDIRALIKRCFGLDAGYRKVSEGGCILQVSDGRLRPLFQGLGIIQETRGNASGWKRKVCVPEVIWRSPQAVVREFLRGYFEGDGWRSPSGNNVKCFAKDTAFCRDLQVLLLGFGIPSYLSSALKQLGNGEYSGCELRMRVLASKLFVDRIGFASRRKSERAPLPKPKRGKGLGRPAKDSFDTDEVVSVVHTGEFGHVYDLTIEGRHYYGVNGLTVHNTIESAFVDSGTTPFPRDSLDALERGKQVPLAVGLFEGEDRFEWWEQRGDPITHVHRDPNPWQQIRIYAGPQNGEKYTMGVDTDVAYESEDSDSTVAQIVRVRDCKIVATYEAKVGSHELIKQLLCLYRWYFNCYYAVETAGMGYDLQRRCVSDAKMSNVHMYKRYDAQDPEPTRYPGWDSQMPFVRPMMDQKLLEYVCHRDRETGKAAPLCIIPDAKTLKEIRGLLRQPSGAFKAKNGHDDHVDALEIAWCIADDPYSGISRKTPDDGGEMRQEFEQRFRWVTGEARNPNRPSLANL